MAGVLIVLLIFFYINIKGSKKYKNVVKDISRKEYAFKVMLPAGLLTGEFFKIFGIAKIRAKVMPLLYELKGEEKGEIYYKINISYRIILIFFSLIIIFAAGNSRKFDIGYVIFTFALIALSINIPDWILKDKIKKRRKNIQIELPGFVNRLVLLVNAGFNIGNAWKKIARDSKKDTPLYICIKRAALIMESSRGEKTAYEYFSKAVKNSDATRIISLILQNYKRGNDHIVPILKVAAQACLEKRRNNSKAQGEEASVKLLFPMTLLMLSVIIIVAAPALSALLNM